MSLDWTEGASTKVWYVEEYDLWRWKFQLEDVILGSGVAYDSQSAHVLVARAISEYAAILERKANARRADS